MLVEKFLIGNPDTVDIGRGRVGYFELVEVVVFPSHRVLDGNVEVPEAVVARDLDCPPHRRLHLLQRHLAVLNVARFEVHIVAL